MLKLLIERISGKYVQPIVPQIPDNHPWCGIVDTLAPGGMQSVVHGPAHPNAVDRACACE
jgi:hypothetical protein